MKVEIGKVFTIIKGKRTARWKIIPHPWLCAYELVRDYHGMYGVMNNAYRREDEDHIVAVVDLEDAYEVAYEMT